MQSLPSKARRLGLVRQVLPTAPMKKPPEGGFDPNGSLRWAGVRSEEVTNTELGAFRLAAQPRGIRCTAAAAGADGADTDPTQRNS